MKEYKLLNQIYIHYMKDHIMKEKIIIQNLK